MVKQSLVVSVYAIKLHKGSRGKAPLILNLAPVQVSGQLHALTALPLGKNPGTHWVGPRTGLYVLWTNIWNTFFWCHALCQHRLLFYVHCSNSNSIKVKFNNCPTRCDLFSLLHFCRQLYMFRVLTPIIRSWCNCNYSFWYWLTRSTTIRSTDSCVSYLPDDTHESVTT